MTRDDAPRLKQMLTATYELYRKELTGITMRLWMSALKGYDIEVVSAALSAHMRNPDNGQFLPMPADIVKLIEGGSDDVALQAWAKVDRAVRMVGTYRSVVFDDAIIHHAIANMGGWISLGQKKEEDWPFVRNQFVALYRGARMRAIEYPARLIGIAEANNSADGKRLSDPVLLGEHALALQVQAKGHAGALPLIARPAGELLPALENRP